MICLLEYFLKSTGQNKILENCHHLFSRCSGPGQSGHPVDAPNKLSPVLPPPPTCLSHLAHLSACLSRWCNIHPNNPEVQAPNQKVSSFLSHLCYQPNVPRRSQLHVLCLTAHLGQAPSMLPHFLPSGMGTSPLCSIWSHAIFHFSKIILSYKFQVMFILEVLSKVGKNNEESKSICNSITCRKQLLVNILS